MFAKLRRHSLLIFGLVSAAVLVYWLPGTEQDRQADPRPTDADYYMENFELVETGPHGRPQRWLQADYLAHYADDSTRLTLPRMKIHTDSRTGPQQWTLKALTGRIQGSSDVQLTGEVRLNRIETKNNPALQIDTNQLRVNLEAEMAETDDLVRLESDQATLRAHGLRLFMSEQRLQLLSQVTGHYEPR